MLFQRLLRHRIIFLGQQVDDELANRICAELILLAAEDAKRDISLYINSPGGSVYAGMAIYDVMQYVPNDVATYAMGMAASMGQFLLCAGAHGKRYAMPHAAILMHQPHGGIGGTATDIRIQAEQSLYLKRVLAERIAIAYRQARRADRGGLRPGPLVHRRGGPRLRNCGPRGAQRDRGPVRRPGVMSRQGPRKRALDTESPDTEAAPGYVGAHRG